MMMPTIVMMSATVTTGTTMNVPRAPQPRDGQKRVAISCRTAWVWRGNRPATRSASRISTIVPPTQPSSEPIPNGELMGCQNPLFAALRSDPSETVVVLPFSTAEPAARVTVPPMTMSEESLAPACVPTRAVGWSRTSPPTAATVCLTVPATVTSPLMAMTLSAVVPNGTTMLSLYSQVVPGPAVFVAADADVAPRASNSKSATTTNTGRGMSLLMRCCMSAPPIRVRGFPRSTDVVPRGRPRAYSADFPRNAAAWPLPCHRMSGGAAGRGGRAIVWPARPVNACARWRQSASASSA